MAPLDPRHVRVAQFAAPTADEKRHHFLWPLLAGAAGLRRDRGLRSLLVRPGDGRAGRGLRTEEQWKRAYREIDEFERTLADEGAIIVKLWLNVSAEEQLKRFEAREKDPLKIVEADRRGLAQPRETAAVRGGGGGDAGADRPRGRPLAGDCGGVEAVRPGGDDPRRQRGNRAGDAARRTGSAAPAVNSRSGPVLEHEEPHPLIRFRILALLACWPRSQPSSRPAGRSGSSGSSGEDPQKVLESASLEGVESGELDLVAERQRRRRRRRRSRRQASPARSKPARRANCPSSS